MNVFDDEDDDDDSDESDDEDADIDDDDCRDPIEFCSEVIYAMGELGRGFLKAAYGPKFRERLRAAKEAVGRAAKLDQDACYLHAAHSLCRCGAPMDNGQRMMLYVAAVDLTIADSADQN